MGKGAIAWSLLIGGVVLAIIFTPAVGGPVAALGLWKIIGLVE